MAYNPYYPYYGQQSQQMQSNGLVSVRSIDEALRYPVAPGNSVTFKDETAPYIDTILAIHNPIIIAIKIVSII